MFWSRQLVSNFFAKLLELKSNMALFCSSLRELLQEPQWLRSTSLSTDEPKEPAGV